MAVRDQIIIGLTSKEIRQDARKHSWDLDNLQKNGARIENACKGASEIMGDLSINKMGKYSYKNYKQDAKKEQQKHVNCYFCGTSVNAQLISRHVQQCPAKGVKCKGCGNRSLC